MINKSLRPSLYKIITTKAHGQLTLFDNWLSTLHTFVRHGTKASVIHVSPTQSINLTSDYKDILLRIRSTAGTPITMTVDPQITGGVDGQRITFEGIDSTATVTFVTNNGLKLAGGASFTLAQYDILVLQFNEAESLWLERSRSDNN